ncbi:MAG: DUF4388 domain-containing protein [bacterium]|nr:DUF4388 domain-containing protein [bacterium]
MELDLQGSIERFTLPEILQLIAAGRKSGTLGIQRDDSIVMVYFSGGEIVYSYGPRQTYHLGQLLKDSNAITADQLDEAVQLQANEQNSKRLGEILIERKYIDRADLQSAVRKQVEQLLYSLLAWDSGTFKFYENQFPTEEEITVRISVENVILEGLRRMDELNMARETLTDPDATFAMASAQEGRSRDVKMDSDEWNVLALVDGRKSVRQICTSSPLGSDKAMTILAKLKLAGLITKSDPRPTGDYGNLETMTNRLAGLFENYLNVRPVKKPTDRTISTSVVETSVED